jgi:hypothetical protein
MRNDMCRLQCLYDAAARDDTAATIERDQPLPELILAAPFLDRA